MKRYSRKKTRASKKSRAQKQKEQAELKRKRSLAAKKGWKTRRLSQKRRKPARKKPAPAKQKKPAKRSVIKRKKTAAAKRKSKNKRIAKRVEARNKLHDKAKGKKLSPKRKKQLTKREREEKRKIEGQRLFDERIRQIQEKEQRQKANKAEIVATLQKRFNALLAEAKRTRQLPRVPRQQKVDSPRFIGVKRHVNIGAILLPENVEDILYRVKQTVAKIPKRASQGWLAVLNFASLGESLLGYGQVILVSSLPGASLFQVQGIDSSGIHNSPEGMLSALEDKLEDLAGESSATVFINFITISAYQRRV